MKPREIIGTAVFFFLTLLSMVGGVGGGGMAIPLAMYFFSLRLKAAIAVASFSIMASSAARWIFSLKELHPEKPNCISLDYGLASVMMPLTIAGSLIGAYFYAAFPEIILQILLTLILAVLAWSCWKKYLELFLKETEQAKKKESSDQTPSTIQQVKPDPGTEKEKPKQQSRTFEAILPSYNLPSVPSNNKEDDQEVELLHKLIRQEMGHGQWMKQGLSFVCLLLLICKSLLRSSSSSISLEKCGVGDWISVAIFFGILLCIVFFSVKNIAQEQKVKKKYGNINLVSSDLVFEGKVLYQILGLGFGGGWIAGTVGLGGGMIYNPLLLQMGVPPKVSSATGLYLVTFAKIATSLLYFVFGLLYVDYAIWVAFWSALGGVAGLWTARKYMEKNGRQSIIVLCLTIVLALSVISVPFFGIRDLIKAHDNGESITEFKSIC